MRKIAYCNWIVVPTALVLATALAAGCSGEDRNMDLFDPPYTEGDIDEVEPNDLPTFPQDLGILLPGGGITVHGDISKTGFMPIFGDGDSDNYVVEAGHEGGVMALNIRLSWDVAADDNVMALPLDDEGMIDIDIEDLGSILEMPGVTQDNPEDFCLEVEPGDALDLWVFTLPLVGGEECFVTAASADDDIFGEPGAYTLELWLSETCEVE
ncbi:hypothetical protein ACFL4G_03310 [Thermodesulfobacteriota bacterium]